MTTAGFDALLAFSPTDAGPDRVTGTVQITEAIHQPYGIVHGGALCAVVENAATLGASLWYGDRGRVQGFHNSTHFLRATREGILHVEAVPVHRGRTQQLWAVRITDEQDRLVSTGEVRLANIADAG